MVLLIFGLLLLATDICVVVLGPFKHYDRSMQIVFIIAFLAVAAMALTLVGLFIDLFRTDTTWKTISETPYDVPTHVSVCKYDDQITMFYADGTITVLDCARANPCIEKTTADTVTLRMEHLVTVKPNWWTSFGNNRVTSRLRATIIIPEGVTSNICGKGVIR